MESTSALKSGEILLEAVDVLEGKINELLLETEKFIENSKL